MPAVKNILALLGDSTSGAAPLQVALRAARQFDAHVDVLHVRPDPVAALPLVGDAMSGAMVDEMVAIAEREGIARATRARALYDRVTAQAEIGDDRDPPGPGHFSATWLEENGLEEKCAALRAARADFTVLPRPTEENSPVSLSVLDSVLMHSGRPVLAAPPGDIPNPRAPFRRIAVFWNGSTEATRAVAGALPFLTAAEQVTVLRVEEEEWFAPSEDLEAYLSRHGVAPVIRKLLPKEGRTGRTLLTGAAEADADLMVMGAYTRSKVRQLILGSVTGFVMKHATLPVFLCH